MFSLKSKKQRAIDEYNLALEAKYKADWQRSLEHGQRAAELNPKDEATWWNLGIAATALRDWPEARRAWRQYGIEDLGSGDGEILWDSVTACVRLNPEKSGEVVWGTRIDPARIRVENVPMPSSERRYGDVLLHDGAPEGTRISHGDEYPVFDELDVWSVSSYSTYAAQLTIPTEGARETLERLCEEKDVVVEDWGTVRMLCEECSRGNPGEHACTRELSSENRHGFAARSESVVQAALRAWSEVEPGVAYTAVMLAVKGRDDA